jgi:DNA-binding transcriptional regulator YiaG
MTADELRTIAIARFGAVNWKAKLAEEIGVHVSTVKRWARGHTIPAPSALAIRSLRPD